ncbi:hypothetical protein [Parabacteroides faecis]|uniref:hypothetical protein n=1 Tax=Parabacteroides faecis TaxID=1217282 RepID=UPI0021653BD5|nr:hypothetical protein [Parabacteroides faecis]MCS2893542.1 hypothetical protein [Parabacteroides faecis]
MAKKKKKYSGHYCKICGERKANEKFSGKGHAVHICKECLSLPTEAQTDMRRVRDVELLFGKYPLTRQDWELLEKYSKKYSDKESGQFAQSILDTLRAKPSFDEDIDIEEYNDDYECLFTDIDRLPAFAEMMKFKELHSEFKTLLREYIHREVSDYWELHKKNPPEHILIEMRKRMLCVVEEEYNIALKNDALFRQFFHDNAASAFKKLQKKMEESG